MAITFDKANRLIQITSPQTSVSIQEIVNAVRHWEAESENMDIDTIINTSGKQSLGHGVFVGITLELKDDWRIEFEARPGPEWVSCRIYGGNLVAINSYDNNPIKPSAFTQVTIFQQPYSLR